MFDILFEEFGTDEDDLETDLSDHITAGDPVRPMRPARPARPARPSRPDTLEGDAA